jgi:hypothetical protein
VKTTDQTNRYYHQYLATLDNISFPLADDTEPEMFLFLAIIVQMGHDMRDSLADYWLTTEVPYTLLRQNTQM